MSKTTKYSGETAVPATTTIVLRAPIEHEGATITEIALREPKVADSLRVEKEAKGAPAEALVALIGHISDLPKGAAEKVAFRDLTPITDWLKRLNDEALALDGALDQGAIEELDAFGISMAAPAPLGADEVAQLDGERVFDLIIPVEIQGSVIRQVTLREPTLAAMRDMTKFKEPVLMTAALVASVAGISPAAVAQMVQRDLNRLEAWLAPFVEALASAQTG